MSSRRHQDRARIEAGLAELFDEIGAIGDAGVDVPYRTEAFRSVVASVDGHRSGEQHGPLMTIRAVCFDLDGTLLRDDHVDGVVLRVARDLASQYDLDPDALAAANERVWWDYWPDVGEAWMRGRSPAATCRSRCGGVPSRRWG